MDQAILEPSVIHLLSLPCWDCGSLSVELHGGCLSPGSWMPYSSINFVPSLSRQPFLPCPVCKGLFRLPGLVSSTPYCLFVAPNIFLLLSSPLQQLPVWEALDCSIPRRPQQQLSVVSRLRVSSSRQTGASDRGGIPPKITISSQTNTIQYLLASKEKKSAFLQCLYPPALRFLTNQICSILFSLSTPETLLTDFLNGPN